MILLLLEVRSGLSETCDYATEQGLDRLVIALEIL